ncbi:hypothetical protein [Aquipseudomonas ullengensis]|uniref:Uncharacterized protein n=1 Tax=Aquipseudomonas ullengensis TaxID=2759166 RepID=A0A7W4LLN8_9GAMM|nr:hypothetical protein [Pseudomonas ullengensis]
MRGIFKQPAGGVPLVLRGAGLLALGVAVAPAAGLIAPSSGGDDSQCAPLLKQMQGKG